MYKKEKERHMKGKISRWLGVRTLAAVLVLFGIVACGGVAGQVPQPTANQLSTESTTPVPGIQATLTASPSGGFRDVVRLVSEDVKPAVVEVTNEQALPGLVNPSGAVPVGVGTGVIYDNQGHILTNDHVVTGAQSIVVSLPDGRTFPAKLLGEDARTDLAVVQISGSNLPVAVLGDSSQVQVGDWVVAIGNALALSGGPTVTAGVVGATGRAIQEPSTSTGAGPFLFDLIQTDAPINPGNSGGPLVNLDGQVIGINTLGGGATSSGVQTQGIGFAISINTAKPIADQLVATGKVIHPYLGISYVPLNPALAAQNGIPVPYGAYVTAVVPGSPAANAGVQVNDVITAIDGTNLDSDSALAQILNQHKPGDTVTLTVQRGSQTLTVKVTLGEAPA
jgi:S1-C subfamily serine protease